MQKLSFAEALERILQDDSRYDAEAYLFLKEALDHTVRTLGKPRQGPQRHVSGQELLEGIRDYALQEYGPMAFRVLDTWGVKRCEDFGELVFNLIAVGIFGKTDTDKKEDFAGGYDFYDAFVKPFLPPSALRGAKGRSRDDGQRSKQKAAMDNT